MSSSESEVEKKRSSTPEYKKMKRGESSKIQKHRTQKYRPEWEQTSEFRNWLSAFPRDSTKAMCRLCDTSFKAELTVIKNHAKSAKHLIKVKNAPKATITKFFDKQESSGDLQKKTAEIKLTAYLTEHNISFNSSSHLVKILKDIFPDSKIAKEITLGRTKARQIVTNVIGTCSEEELIHHLKSNKFSIIIDESTDISSVKTLCVCVRFFHPNAGKITTLFWRLLQIFSGDNPDQANEGATAERLYNELINLFTVNNISLDNLIGFASDGCNTMFGKHNSVASKLSALLPGIVIQKCICHSLHLCASEACKHFPRICEDLARNIYNFFKNSAKRQAMFKEFQDFCDTEPHQILRPSQTRWLSLLAVVKRILEQWEPLRLFFASNYLEHRLIASEEIYNALNNKAIRLYYLFLDYILPKFVDLNKYFQGEKVLILVLNEKMEETYLELLCTYMETNYVRKSSIEQIDPSNETYFLPLNSMYLGIGVLQNIDSVDEATKTDFFYRCRQFLITSCIEIKKRYNFNDPVLTKIHILQQSNIHKYDSLLPLIETLPRICNLQNVSSLQKIDDQWRALKNFNNLPTNKEIDTFYGELSKVKDTNDEFKFKDLCNFAKSVLSLPHSSASCERVFSKVNLIKTKTRNRLLTNSLNGLLLSSQCIKLETNCTQFKPSKKMLDSMTSAQLYKKHPATSSTKSDDEEDDDDIYFDFP